MTELMRVQKKLEHFFKPEIRNRGVDFFTAGEVRISYGSETAIEAFVRGSTSAKVRFSTASISDEVFFADCSCPPAQKGVLCKHIWATLLAAEKVYPDFFENKNSIEKITKPAVAESPYKVKQAEYKKQQYEKQKQRAKNLKQASKKSKSVGPRVPEFSPEVMTALQFFSVNGFPMEYPFDEELLRNAKKQLSRVFHPDKGGSHQETVLLNENFDLLMEVIGHS